MKKSISCIKNFYNIKKYKIYERLIKMKERLGINQKMNRNV